MVQRYLARAFGRRVQLIRSQNGMSQAQLAEAVHVSEEWIRRIERGAGSPSFGVIEDLPKVLSVEPVQLFGALSGGKPEEDPLAVAAARLTGAEREWLEATLKLIFSRPRREG